MSKHAIMGVALLLAATAGVTRAAMKNRKAGESGIVRGTATAARQLGA
jgi:hypothetical protein